MVRYACLGAAVLVAKCSERGDTRNLLGFNSVSELIHMISFFVFRTIRSSILDNSGVTTVRSEIIVLESSTSSIFPSASVRRVAFAKLDSHLTTAVNTVMLQI